MVYAKSKMMFLSVGLLCSSLCAESVVIIGVKEYKVEGHKVTPVNEKQSSYYLRYDSKTKSFTEANPSYTDRAMVGMGMIAVPIGIAATVAFAKKGSMPLAIASGFGTIIAGGSALAGTRTSQVSEETYTSAIGFEAFLAGIGVLVGFWMSSK